MGPTSLGKDAYPPMYPSLLNSVLFVDDGTAQRGSAEQPYRNKAAGS